MARIAYALTSQGLGHTARALALAPMLRRRGHELRFLCSGRSLPLLRAEGHATVEIPSLTHVIRDNRLWLWTSLAWAGLQRIDSVRRFGPVMEAVRDFDPDVIVSDFEVFSTVLARRLDKPLVALSHQQVVTHVVHDVPAAHAWEAFVARVVVRAVTPRDPVERVITALLPGQARGGATLVGPILREDVLRARPTVGDHVIVYHNDPTAVRSLVARLGGVDARFLVYGAPPGGAVFPPNVERRPLGTRGFLEDLASARAVIASGGYTLMSEALFLGKPILMVPNAGLYEQTFNALLLQRERLGEAVLRRVPTEVDVTGFLDRVDAYRERIARLELRPGNAQAVERIEGAARADLGRSSAEPVPPTPFEIPRSGAQKSSFPDSLLQRAIARSDIRVRVRRVAGRLRPKSHRP